MVVFAHRGENRVHQWRPCSVPAYSQRMRNRRTVAVVWALALIAGACSGDGGIDLPPLDSSSVPAEDDGTLATATEIGSDGGVVELPGDVVIEAMAGTFESPTPISVEAGGSAILPPGVTAKGRPVTITAGAEPGIPVLVGLPTPDGVDPGELFILRTTDGGQQQILGGFVEGDTYLAATPGFSEFQLVDHALDVALDVLAAGELPESLRPPSEDTTVPDNMRGALLMEYYATVLGEISAPAPRSLKVYGPGEVAVGTEAIFAAVEFDSINELFVEYSWEVHGEGLSISDTTGEGRAVVEGVAVGRALITVEATDPLTGATGFGSMRVFVVEDTLTIVALPLRSIYFAEDESGPNVYVGAEGGTPPYRWSWTWQDGASGTSELLGPDVQHSPISEDMTLTINVKDANGIAATTTVAMRGLPGSRDAWRGLLVGPPTGTVGEEVVFAIELWRPETAPPLEPAVVLLGETGTAAVDGDVVRATFDEPGVAVLRLYVADPNDPSTQVRLAEAYVRIIGDAPLAEARFGEAPAQTAVGVPTEFTIEARGGVIAGPDENSYSATVDFDDDPLVEVPIPAETALDWASATVEHTWEEEGLYTISLAIVTPDGQTAVATMEVEVTAERRAVGAFELFEVEGITVIANRVVMILDGGSVEFRTFRLDTEYQWTQFTIGGDGEEESFPVDCIRYSTTRLTESDVTLNLNRMRFRGTVTIRDKLDDEGTECPFGGGHRDVIRVGEVSGTLADGIISMTIFFPTIPEAHETTRTITAEVL